MQVLSWLQKGPKIVQYIPSSVFRIMEECRHKKIKAAQILSPALDGQHDWGDRRHAETRAPAPLFTFLPFTMLPCSFSTHSHIGIPTALLTPFQANRKKDPHQLQGTTSTFPTQPALMPQYFNTAPCVAASKILHYQSSKLLKKQG